MTLPNLPLVERIWSYSPQGKPTVESKKEGEWLVLPGIPVDQPFGKDLYFTPLKFKGRRSNENALSMGVLFADLDPVNPMTCDPEPSVSWETSPGNYQAIWYLREPWDFYQEWADVNQRLTYHLKADKGGWMGSKLLRWPGSLNWKRQRDGAVPVGRVVSTTLVEYDFVELRDALPPIERTQVVSTGRHPVLNTIPLLNEQLRMHWADISLQGRAMLTRDRVSDRSLHIVRTAHELLRSGLSTETAFNMLWVAPWNKWRTDRHMPEKLWEEILLADAKLQK